jgi:hypothetical protein
MARALARFVVLGMLMRMLLASGFTPRLVWGRPDMCRGDAVFAAYGLRRVGPTGSGSAPPLPAQPAGAERCERDVRRQLEQ